MNTLCKAFRSGNTLRLTLNAHARRGLAALPGDIMILSFPELGHAEIENLSHEERQKRRRPRR